MAFVRIQQFTRSTEVTDVGHAGTDKYFVDLLTLYRRQRTRVIRVVRCTEDWLFNIRQIDVDHCRVFSICIGFQQLRIRQPFFHALNTTFQGATIAVTFRDHPLQQDDVRVQVFDDRFFVQLDGTTSGRTLGGRIGQFKCLLNFQIRQTFNFQDAAREDVFLAFLLNGQQTLFDRIQRNGVYQIAQGDARLHFAFEAHQNGFRHIQRHYACCGCKCHQTRTRRERDTDRETGMGITTGTDGIRQQHTVQPGVNDAVTRTQRHTATVHNEVRQRVVRVHVNWLRIRRGVAERLHHQVSREAQARQVFQFITGHRAGGVLGTYRSHFRFTVRARTNAFHATGTAYHFLRQREAAIALSDIFRLTEHITVRQTKCFTRFGGQATPDNQRNTATSTHFINQHVGFQFEGRQQFAGFVVTHFTFVRVNVNHVAHVQVRDVDFDWQCTRVFHRVKEDGCNFTAEAQTTAAFVRHMWNIIAHKPQNGVSGGFTRRTRTHNVTDVRQRETFLLQSFDLLDRTNNTRLVWLNTFTGVFQHRQRVQWDIRA